MIIYIYVFYIAIHYISWQQMIVIAMTKQILQGSSASPDPDKAIWQTTQKHICVHIRH
jgi:hypothetical protein